MKLGQFTKQPRERETYTINYATDLTEGDVLETAIVEVSPSGLNVTHLVVNPRVRFWVSGGQHNVDYTVTSLTKTASGRELEDEFVVKVKER